MHTELQKAYLAGFFDGDGHVQLGLLGQKCRMQAGREAYIDRHTYQRTCPACQREFTARLKQIYCSVKCSSRHAYTRRDYKKTVTAT